VMPGDSGTGGPGDILYSWDVARFARERLGFEADATQSLVMNGRIPRGLLNCTRQWGKSTITAIMAVHRAYFKKGSLTIAVSPSGRQTGEFLRKAKDFARKLGVKARGDGDNEISMLFPNGSRIVGLPGSEATVRGFSAVSLMLIDEAARVSDQLYKAVRPFLAVGGGDLWLMSTPFGKRGFFYEEWSREGRWAKFNILGTECPRIPRAFLEEEKTSMGEQWFRQEYMCEFVDVGGSLFDRDVIERAFTNEVRPLF
jgi:hypothetical protein